MTMISILDHSGLFCDLGSFWPWAAFSVISNQWWKWEVGKWG